MRTADSLQNLRVTLQSAYHYFRDYAANKVVREGFKSSQASLTQDIVTRFDASKALPSSDGR
jgi:hypothetical protein